MTDKDPVSSPLVSDQDGNDSAQAESSSVSETSSSSSSGSESSPVHTADSAPTGTQEVGSPVEPNPSTGPNGPSGTQQDPSPEVKITGPPAGTPLDPSTEAKQSWAEQTEAADPGDFVAMVPVSNPFGLLCESMAPLSLASPLLGDKTPKGAFPGASTGVKARNPTDASLLSKAGEFAAIQAMLAAKAAVSAPEVVDAPVSPVPMDTAPADTADTGAKGTKSGKRNRHQKKAGKKPVLPPTLSELIPKGMKAPVLPTTQAPPASETTTYSVAQEDRRAVATPYRARWASIPEGLRCNPPICGNPELMKAQARKKYNVFLWKKTKDSRFLCPHCETPQGRVTGVVRHVHSAHYPYVVELRCVRCPTKTGWRRKEDFRHHVSKDHPEETVDYFLGTAFNPKYLPPLPSENTPFIFHDEVLRDHTLLGTKGKLPLVNPASMSAVSMKTVVQGLQSTKKGETVKRAAPTSTVTSAAAPTSSSPVSSAVGPDPPSKRKRKNKKKTAGTETTAPGLPGVPVAPGSGYRETPSVFAGLPSFVMPPNTTLITKPKSTGAPVPPVNPTTIPGAGVAPKSRGAVASTPKKRIAPDPSRSLKNAARTRLAAAVKRQGSAGGATPRQQGTYRFPIPSALTLGEYASVVSASSSRPQTSLLGPPPGFDNPQPSVGSGPGVSQASSIRDLPVMQTLGSWASSVEELHKAVQQPPENWTLQQLRGAEQSCAARRRMFDQADLEWEKVKSANYAVEASLARTSAALSTHKAAEAKIMKLENQVAKSQKEIDHLKAQLSKLQSSTGVDPLGSAPASDRPSGQTDVTELTLRGFPNLHVRQESVAAQVADLRAVTAECWQLATRALSCLPPLQRSLEFQRFASGAAHLDWYAALQIDPQVESSYDLRSAFEVAIARADVTSPSPLGGRFGSGGTGVASTRLPRAPQIRESTEREGVNPSPMYSMSSFESRYPPMVSSTSPTAMSVRDCEEKKGEEGGPPP